MSKNVLMVIPLFLGLVLIGLLPSMSRAQAPQAPTPFEVAHFGGAVQSVAAQGDFAYTGVGSQFTVVDVADPARPIRRGVLEMAGQVVKVVVTGTHAYVAVGQGLHVVAISNPDAPVTRRSLNAPEPILDIALQGDYAYVVDGGSLRVIDISDPSLPQEVSFFKIGSEGAEDDAYVVQVQGNYAYVTYRYWAVYRYGGTALIIDISNPRFPAHVTNFEVYTLSRLAVSGERAYLIVDRSYGDKYTIYSLDTYDISVPVSPTLRSSVDMGWDTVYQTLAVAGSYAYIGSRDTLEIRYLGDNLLRAPVTITMPGDINDIIIASERAYIAAASGGMRVLSLASPSVPRPMGALETIGNAAEIVVVNGYPYVADRGVGPHYPDAYFSRGNAIKVIDLDHAPAPVTGIIASEVAGRITVQGDRLYSPSGGCRLWPYDDCWGGFDVFSIISPTAATLMGHYELAHPPVGPAGPPSTVEVSGTLAYVLRRGEMDIVDVSSPVTPTQAGFYTGSLPSLLDVDLKGTYAYVAGGMDGVRVLDMTEPTTPTLVGTLEQFPVQVLNVEGDYGYLGSQNTLQVIDARLPNHPIALGRYSASGTIEAIAVQGRYAYVALGEAGVELVDISDPARPLGVARYDTPGFAQDVAVSGAAIYVADGANGLLRLHYELPTPVSVGLEPTRSTTLHFTDTQGLRTQIMIPVGAVTESLTLDLMPRLVAAPPGSAWAAHAFTLQLSRNGLALPDRAFEMPVTIELQYSDADLHLVSREAGLALYSWNGTAWREASATCHPPISAEHDLTNNTLAVVVCRTGHIALFGPTNTLYLPVGSR